MGLDDHRRARRCRQPRTIANLDGSSRVALHYEGDATDQLGSKIAIVAVQDVTIDGELGIHRVQGT